MAAISITQSVGEGCKNFPLDVTKVENLLRTAKVPERTTLNGWLEEFQMMCGLNPDGRAGPRGDTLRILNAITNKPKLTIRDTRFRGENPPFKSEVSRCKVEKGGYEISYWTDDGKRRVNTKIPSPYRVLLGTSCFNTIDVSDRPPNDVMDEKTLVKLLKLIERLGSWEQSLTLQLYFELNGSIIAQSNTDHLRCPVKPHSGRMLSEQENKGMPYLGDLQWGAAKTKKFWGRMFVKPKGYDKYLFVWARYLEIDPTKRGFDCITFAGAVCGARHIDMSKRGEDLAEGLNSHSETSYCASPCGTAPVRHGTGTLDNARMKDIGSFFESNKTGHYLLYSTGHVTLFSDGNVFEFKPKKGFAKTEVSKWVGDHSGRWTVKRLVNRPPLADA